MRHLAARAKLTSPLSTSLLFRKRFVYTLLGKERVRIHTHKVKEVDHKYENSQIHNLKTKYELVYENRSCKPEHAVRNNELTKNIFKS